MNNEIPCFECNDGILREVHTPYHAHLPNGKLLKIEDCPMWTCDKCRDSCTDDKQNLFIEKAIDDYYTSNGITRRSRRSTSQN